MKRIIDISEEDFDEAKMLLIEGVSNNIEYAVANGTPYTERPQGEWIPVSERLPDKNGECLVSLDFGDVNIDAFVDGFFVCYLGNVIAWQPLPEPYKKGGAE